MEEVQAEEKVSKNESFISSWEKRRARKAAARFFEEFFPALRKGNYNDLR